MDNFDTKTYYALLWNTSLDLGREMKVKGSVLCKDSELPNDPRILYGANMNDVAKIKRPKLWKKIEYDVRTTQQKVLYWSDTEEYTLLRDVRIVVWAGHDELWLPYDDYKIVIPEHFEFLSSNSKYYKCDFKNNEGNYVEGISSLSAYKDPKEGLDGDILDRIISNSELGVKDLSYKSDDVNIIKSERLVDGTSLLDDYWWAIS